MTRWSASNLDPPPRPHVVELLGAISQGKPLCDVSTENFNHPDRQWDALATPDRTAAFIACHAPEQAVLPA